MRGRHDVAVDLDGDAAAVVAQLLEQFGHCQRRRQGPRFAVHGQADHGGTLLKKDSYLIRKQAFAWLIAQGCVFSSRAVSYQPSAISRPQVTGPLPGSLADLTRNAYVI